MNRKGFTLVEVVLSIAVILIIMGGVMLGFNTIKDNAARMAAGRELSQKLANSGNSDKYKVVPLKDMSGIDDNDLLIYQTILIVESDGYEYVGSINIGQFSPHLIFRKTGNFEKKIN